MLSQEDLNITEWIARITWDHSLTIEKYVRYEEGFFDDQLVQAQVMRYAVLVANEASNQKWPLIENSSPKKQD